MDFSQLVVVSNKKRILRILHPKTRFEKVCIKK